MVIIYFTILVYEMPVCPSLKLSFLHFTWWFVGVTYIFSIQWYSSFSGYIYLSYISNLCIYILALRILSVCVHLKSIFFNCLVWLMALEVLPPNTLAFSFWSGFGSLLLTVLSLYLFPQISLWYDDFENYFLKIFQEVCCIF